MFVSPRGLHFRPRRSFAACGVATLMAASACQGQGGRRAPPLSAVLRMGVAQLSPNDPIRGLRQLSQLYSVESFLRPNEEGRLQPLLAESATLSTDGRSLRVRLRRGVKFHDGSPVNPAAVVEFLPGALRDFMGPVFPDVEGVVAVDDSQVDVRFATSSPFVVEAMEAPFRKPGRGVIGTGPYVASADSTTEMHAFPAYYHGPPAIDRIAISNYPSVRAAWADMLRDRIDMLYEVGTDALDSMTGSKNISLFTFTRHYQYALVLNPESPAMRLRELRQALNWAVDRNELVRVALEGHGVTSSAPLPAGYWASRRDAPKFGYDVQRAASLLHEARARDSKPGAPFRFTCLLAPDAVNERVALELKRQFQNVGVEMTFAEATQDQMFQRASKGDYDALLIEMISAPTLFRPYLVWHSGSPLNFGRFGNRAVDAALDHVRRAPSETAYRDAVLDLQQAFLDDPPAVFLAWTVRARAVSKRFEVPAEEGRDVLSTLRLWKPTGAADLANRN